MADNNPTLLFPPGRFAHIRGRYPLVPLKRGYEGVRRQGGRTRKHFRFAEPYIPAYRVMPKFRSYRKSSYQRNKRRARTKYPRAGSRAIATRPSRGLVTPNEVKRQYAESATQAWPTGDGLGAPSRSPIYVPFSYQFWNRGLADSNFTGSKVTLKNISVMMQLIPPVNVPTANNKPYRLRITQGWCKQHPQVDMASTAAVGLASQYPNGMATGQPAPVATTLLRGGAALATEPAHIQALFRAQSDFVGIYGNHQNEASYPKTMYMIISDTTQTWAPLTEVAGAAPATVDRQFSPKILKFNFTANKQIRLSAMTTAVANPPVTNAEWFSPVNTPGQWVPFVNVAILNPSADHTNVNQLPTCKITENAYFLDN